MTESSPGVVQAGSRRVDEDFRAITCWISAEQQAYAQLSGFQAALFFLKKHVYEKGPQFEKVSMPSAVLECLFACLNGWVQLRRGHFET